MSLEMTYQINTADGDWEPFFGYLSVTPGEVGTSISSIAISYPEVRNADLSFAPFFDLLRRRRHGNGRPVMIRCLANGLPRQRMVYQIEGASGTELTDDNAVQQWAFTGRSVIAAKLEEAFVWPRTRVVPRYLPWKAELPGKIIRDYIQACQEYIMAPANLQCSFTDTHDTDGRPFPTPVMVEFGLLDSGLDVVEKVADTDTIEWSYRYMDDNTVMLDVWVAKTRGEDLTLGDDPVILIGSRDIGSADREYGEMERGTHLFVMGGAANISYYYPRSINPNARGGAGPKWTVEQLDGVWNQSVVTQYCIDKWNLINNEDSNVKINGMQFVYDSCPVPFRDFNVGDMILVNVGSGNEKLQVYSIVPTTSQDGLISVAVEVGPKQRSIRLRKRKNQRQLDRWIQNQRRKRANGPLTNDGSDGQNWSAS